MTAKYIKFEPCIAPPHFKTKVWLVETLDGSFVLGTVHWFSKWRKYAFFPHTDTVFEQTCLRDIAEFCETATKDHKAAKKQTKSK